MIDWAARAIDVALEAMKTCIASVVCKRFLTYPGIVSVLEETLEGMIIVVCLKDEVEALGRRIAK